jgi:hypothetical protein
MPVRLALQIGQLFARGPLEYGFEKVDSEDSLPTFGGRFRRGCVCERIHSTAGAFGVISITTPGRGVLIAMSDRMHAV